MKKQILIIAAAAVLGVATGVGSSESPKGRINGDPDEFQSRQVLDEGIAVRDSDPWIGTGGRPVPPAGDQCRPKPAKRREVRNLVNPSFSIDFSGKTVFLER